MKVTFRGETVELEGNPPQVGDQLPKFKLFDTDNNKVKMAQLLGKPLLISIMPDINTRVCSMQTRKFNQQADHYPDATFIAVSNNTIQEQKSWCAAEGVENLRVLSDEELSFGYATDRSRSRFFCALQDSGGKPVEAVTCLNRCRNTNGASAICVLAMHYARLLS